ncbi:hypothetical protein [Luteitalea sp.]
MPLVPRSLGYPLVIFASVAVAVGMWAALPAVVGHSAESAWWVRSLALSSGWLFAAWCVGDSRWARTSVPAFAVTVLAGQYLMAHGLTLAGVGLVGVAIAVNVLHVTSIRARTR